MEKASERNTEDPKTQEAVQKDREKQMNMLNEIILNLAEKFDEDTSKASNNAIDTNTSTNTLVTGGIFRASNSYIQYTYVYLRRWCSFCASQGKQSKLFALVCLCVFRKARIRIRSTKSNCNL